MNTARGKAFRMASFVKGLAFSTSKGVPFVVIIVEAEKRGEPWPGDRDPYRFRYARRCTRNRQVRSRSGSPCPCRSRAVLSSLDGQIDIVASYVTESCDLRLTRKFGVKATEIGGVDSC